MGLEEGAEDEDELRADEEKEAEVPGREVRTDGAKLRSILDPCLPSEAEVRRHALTHLPYRSWCPHCVRGQGKDSAHRRAEAVGKLPEFSWDYCFPGDEDGHKLTVLVGKERRTGMIMAATIPRKGSTGMFAVQKCLEFINECGAAEAKIIVKTDAEPAILALVADIKKARVGLETIEEVSPVGSSGSNGKVERAVQSVEGQLRTMKSAFEERIGRKIMSEERIVLFLTEYCSYLWNRLHVGDDGLTAYEKVKGKKASVLAVEFGEKMLYKIKNKNKLEKINARWEYGIFVGVKKLSNELWVATKDGLKSVRSVKRIPSEHRWGEDCCSWVRHVPWHRFDGDPEADGEIPEFKVPLQPELGRSSEVPKLVVVNMRQPAPREFQIRQSNLDKFGHTRLPRM